MNYPETNTKNEHLLVRIGFGIAIAIAIVIGLASWTLYRDPVNPTQDTDLSAMVVDQWDDFPELGPLVVICHQQAEPERHICDVSTEDGQTPVLDVQIADRGLTIEVQNHLDKDQVEAIENATSQELAAYTGAAYTSDHYDCGPGPLFAFVGEVLACTVTDPTNQESYSSEVTLFSLDPVWVGHIKVDVPD